MKSLLQKTWKIKTPLCEKSVLERVCAHRKIDLKCELQDLHSPWSMKDMQKAVERIQYAIQAQERILIFGDYDVDGVCGSSILYQGLQSLGANVSVRLPHREKDGYGLSLKVIDECKDLGVKVLITVDCGISAIDPIASGMSKGIDIIVTDHHSIPQKLPSAFAILNPKQVDCAYPEKEIVGTVVAYKLLCALTSSTRTKFREEGTEKYLDLAALATVADCAPLLGENRLIVKKGLEYMRNTKHRGLRKLLESYELCSSKRNPNSYDLGFKIAPCINAAGRLEDPLIAFKMLLGDEERALELRALNTERQSIMENALEEALSMVDEQQPAIILCSESWQPGIIGLLAGKLSEKYHKPSICMTLHQGRYVGSCRSIPDINMVEWLTRYASYFVGYGGHAQAAGLTIEKEKLHAFRDTFFKELDAWTKENPVQPVITIDTEICTDELQLETLSDISQLEPFGMGNPKPKFLLTNAMVSRLRVVGKNHLQMQIAKDQKLFRGIAFQMADQKTLIESWKQMDLVCSLQKNTYQERSSLEFQMLDARPSS